MYLVQRSPLNPAPIYAASHFNQQSWLVQNIYAVQNSRYYGQTSVIAATFGENLLHYYN